MPRETQKQKINRLSKELQKKEEELKEWKDLVHKLNNELVEITEKINRGFEASGTSKQMKDKIYRLDQKNQQLEKELKKIHKINNRKKHNDRGAGRKPRFSEKEKKTIKMYRIQGKTIKELSEMYRCSIGLIHKIIK